MWRVGPMVRSLDSGSEGSYRGGSTLGLGTKTFILKNSYPHERDPKSAVLSLKYGGLLIKKAQHHDSKNRKANAKKKEKRLWCNKCCPFCIIFVVVYLRTTGSVTLNQEHATCSTKDLRWLLGSILSRSEPTESLIILYRMMKHTSTWIEEGKDKQFS